MSESTIGTGGSSTDRLGDAGPIDEEAMRAADGLTVDEDVKEHYTEMTELGAHVKGEGATP